MVEKANFEDSESVIRSSEWKTGVKNTLYVLNYRLQTLMTVRCKTANKRHLFTLICV